MGVNSTNCLDWLKTLPTKEAVQQKILLVKERIKNTPVEHPAHEDFKSTVSYLDSYLFKMEDTILISMPDHVLSTQIDHDIVRIEDTQEKSAAVAMLRQQLAQFTPNW